MSELKINKTIDILHKLNDCIKKKEPFGLVRFGDGGLKVMDAYIKDDMQQLIEISEQEGIPLQLYKKIIDFWKTSANNCDYIDCPEVYFTNYFWQRTRKLTRKPMSQKTINRLKNWKNTYKEVEITNENYCNPEINFLMCLAKFRKLSLPSLLENKKICCISSRNDINDKLPDYNIDVIKIVGKNENQYYNSFSKVINIIDKKSNDYDLWLIAAGELGRIYPGLIKFKGGRALDIGSLIDFWCEKEIPGRLLPYVQSTIHHPLKLILTTDGKRYNNYL